MVLQSSASYARLGHAPQPAPSHWNLDDEETPELDSYRNNFIDFAYFFSDDMCGSEFVHRRIKTREIFDLTSSAYVNMRRAAHRAEAAADAVALADSDDDADDNDVPPLSPQQQPASQATSSANEPGHGAGRLGAASNVATPPPGPPPNAAADAADAAAVLVSAPARVPRAVAERKETDSAPSRYHSGNALSTTPATGQGNLHACEVVGALLYAPSTSPALLCAGCLSSVRETCTPICGCQPAAREGTSGVVVQTSRKG